MAIIGIDLGTSTCEIACYKNGKPTILRNKEGEGITPSYIGIDTYGEWIVGKNARDQFISRPRYTVREVKRKMGTGEKLRIGDSEYTPEEISAKLLKYLKECAEDILGETVDEAVITVPANFNNIQRDATKKAAMIAGIKADRIINEPTAAAMAFGIKNMDKDCTVLVYDFGGGTLDVTVLELFQGILDVKSSSGNNELGGKEFDARLADYIARLMKAKLGVEVKGSIELETKVLEAAEIAKKELSYNPSAVININFLNNDRLMNFTYEIMRSEFERLIDDLIESTGEVIDDALKNNKVNLDYSDIDVVLMVGGSTRVPAVRKFVERKLGKRVKTEINPDEAVALGACIEAAIMKDEINSESGLIKTDVCPYNLGVEIVSYVGDRLVDGVFDVIIERNSTIPITAEKIYYTTNDNQTSVDIKVYQTNIDNCMWTDDAIEIGSFTLEGIPQNAAGQEKINVKMSYNLNGNVDVLATILSIGKSEFLEVKSALSLSIDEVADMAAKENDKWRECTLASKYKLTIENAEKKIKQIKDVSIKNQLLEGVNKLKEYIVNNDEDMADDMDNKLVDMLFDLE